MCVNPGYSGQKFNKKVLDKIKKIKKYCNQKNLNNFFEIGVDGGINNSNIKVCLEAGANVFISGSSIFWNGDVKSNIMSLYSSMEVIMSSISFAKRGLNSSEYVELIKIFTLALEKHKDYMNSLNVFPVPDADTGTNMYVSKKAFKIALKISLI